MWRMEAWGWDVCLRSHFLPFWLQQWAYSSSRRISRACAPITPRCRPTCRNGCLNIVLCQTFFRLSNHSGTNWDQPGVLADKAVVKSSLSSPCQSASFLSASSLRSGDWLFSLLIASCSLRLDEEVARTAVTLRLGLLLCVPHPGRCGSLVSAHFLHSFVCKWVSCLFVPDKHIH